MRPFLPFAVALSGVCLALPCAAQSVAPWEAPARVAPRRPPPPPRRLPPPPPGDRFFSEPPRPARTWYGAYTLAVTGSTLVAGIGASFAGSPEVGLPLAVGGLLLSGPIVHWAHGEGNRGFLALGINVGGPLLGGLAGWGVTCAIADCDGGGDIFAFVVGGGIGAAAGLIAAVVIDVSVLSYSQPARSTARRRLRPGFTVAPDLQLAGDRTTLGLVGTF